MDSTKEYLETWLKYQENTIGNLTEMAKRFQQGLFGFGGSGEGLPDFGGFREMYSSWTTSVLNAMRDTGTPDINLLRDTLSKALTGSNAYLKLYEIWLPLIKAIQEKTASPDTYRNLIEPARYKEVLDRIFGFDPEAISQMTDQATKLLGTLRGSSEGFMKPWLQAAEKNIKTFPQFLAGHPESFMTVFHTMFSAFDSTVGRVFHVPAVGKDREKVELLLRGIDDLSVYLAKTTEYQHVMYITGLAAFEKVIATIAEKISKGEEIQRFDEFFDLWVTVNEKAYYTLFHTGEFSKMQGELLEASLNVRRHFFKLMELYLYDFPIALRSEMDDLYKTIYDLKKKVKSLEKQVKGVSA